mgnify:CR=1 FL=1
MKKTYTEQVIKILSENSNVKYVRRNRLVLTLEFRQKLYDEWVKVSRIGTIRKILNENDVNTRMTGKNSFIFHYQGSSLCGWL